MGYRSDSIAVSRDMGPLSVMGSCKSVMVLFRSLMQPTPQTRTRNRIASENSSRRQWQYTLELVQKQFQSVSVSEMFWLILGVKFPGPFLAEYLLH